MKRQRKDFYKQINLKKRIAFTAFGILFLQASLSYGYTVWEEQEQSFTAPVSNDETGGSVSLNADGTIVAFGAARNSTNATYAGLVRVYSVVDGQWTRMGQDLSSTQDYSFYGSSVSLSNDGLTLAIGATGVDHGTYVYDSGVVQVFHFDGTSWQQMGQSIYGEIWEGAGAGVRLSGDGTTLALGVPGADNLFANSGEVRVMHYSGSSWVQQGSAISGEDGGDLVGGDISLSDDGSTVAIGAYRNNDHSTWSGQVEVYRYSGSAWVQLGADLEGEGFYEQFGSSVSLNGDGSMLAVSAMDDNGGVVRLFGYTTSGWQQLGDDQVADGVDDRLGASVSLSDDGTILATGAPTARVCYNGSCYLDHGLTRVFQYKGGRIEQLGADITGAATNDRVGRSVSLSADGTTIAIGAPGNYLYADSTGSVHIFYQEKRPDIELYMPAIQTAAKKKRGKE